MIEKFIHFLEYHTPLSVEEKKYLHSAITAQHIHKNDLLLKEGHISKDFYFIINGAIRLFYTVEENEKTAFFYFENMFVSSYESFTKQIPSKHNLQAIENTSVAIISHQTAYTLLEKFPKFEFLARIMMEEELAMCQEVISSFVTQNAEERYQGLIQTNSKLLQRVPQYQLASYLGVTPETLSRIRKRISSKKLS